MPEGRGPIPYGLIAAVFIPALGAYVWFLQGVETFRFGHPFALVLIPLAVALVLWAGIRRAPSRRGAIMHSRASELGRRRRGWVSRLADLPMVLRLLVVVLLGLALARPQSARRDDEIELEGIDIVVTLDLSLSMGERDLKPNRLAAAKLVINDFVQRRPADRIGLVVFARDAYTYIPPTLDHGTFLRMLSELRLGIIDGHGTAIGNGLGVALARLRRSDARSRVIILLTDGDNNSGNISPQQAAQYAQKLGVKVYTILAGDNDSTDTPGAGAAKYSVNPKLLEQIATITGGTPYLAIDTRALARRFQEILEELEKSRIRDRAILYSELYPRVLWPAFLILLLELALRLSRLRRLP
jgi:Ca-activated chloride channel family protein